jgi:tetratricopeptide (TPR) repeat protein
VSQSISIPNEHEPENQRNFRKLLLSVQASLKQLNLLIAICDHPTYREELIRDYEAQLTAKGITCLRVQLDRHQTSLKQALLALEAEEPALHEDIPVMVTVCGADQMLSVRLDEEQSAREQFFFSLQWTREALRQFQFPIVIWLTEQIVRELTQQAPDFWSWRGGVFQFVRPLWRAEKQPTEEFQDFQLEEKPKKPISLAESRQKVQDLQKQIATLEAQDPESPLLPSLCSSLGTAYEERLDNGLVTSHAKEQLLAIQAYEKAIALQTEKDSVELAKNLNNLANLYDAQGRYGEAEPLYLRSLKITEQQLGVDHANVAVCLNNLAGLYKSQGRYGEAEPLYLRSLKITEQQRGASNSSTAKSLNNLALLYGSMGRYEEAKPLFVRALSIQEQQMGAAHPDTATSLSNLAFLYGLMGRYEEAEPLYLQALFIKEQQLGATHPSIANTLSNLANLYTVIGRYEEAESLYIKSLAIQEQQMGVAHPDTALSLNNLALLYQLTERYEEAEPLYLQALSIQEQQMGAAHPDTATSLSNLAELYQLMGRYDEAESCFIRSLKINQEILGAAHPDTELVWDGFLRFLQKAVQEGRSTELSDHPTTQRAIEQLRQPSGEIGE